MELWRISNYVDLLGSGGVRAAGRWHSRGKPIVYLADHPANAILEMLVHLDRDTIPTTFRLLRIAVPDTVTAQGADPRFFREFLLQAQDWRQNSSATRELGDAWLDQCSSALMQVPSAIVPGAQNFLLNPAHSDAGKIAVVEVIEAPFDQRLLRDSR